jgi:hypothetical protein
MARQTVGDLALDRLQDRKEPQKADRMERAFWHLALSKREQDYTEAITFWFDWNQEQKKEKLIRRTTQQNHSDDERSELSS